MKLLKQCWASILFCLIVTSNLFAGSSQSSSTVYFKPEQIVKFSKKVEKTLAKKGVRVAIVGRVGRSRKDLPKGISFTHTAFMVYSQVTTSDNRKIPAYVLYNLYQRNNQLNRSDLVQDYPIDFFASVQELEAGIIIPKPKLQKKLLKILTSSTYKKLHNTNYSVIANPFTEKLQNCTEHTLDVVVAAIYDTDNLKVIKNYEKKYFTPQEVDVNPFKLLLGSMFIDDVATSDHTETPATATFTTIKDFLFKYNLASEFLLVN